MLFSNFFFQVSDVADSCGRDRVVDVLYVPTQSERKMTLDEWAKYFEQPESQRSYILNVIHQKNLCECIRIKLRVLCSVFV